MGTRNFDLGARDMKAAGRIALEQGMRSFASIDTMSDRWDRFVDYIRAQHDIGRMENISQDVVIAYGAWLADKVDEELLETATAQNYVSAVNRVLEIARGDRHVAVSPTRDCGIPLRSGVAMDSQFVSGTEHYNWLIHFDVPTRIMIRLQRAFGLRFEEAAKFDARGVDAHIAAGLLPVVNGTKGGRKREVPLCMDAQFDVLQAAAKYQGGVRSLIPEDMSYAEFRRQCYCIATRHHIRFHRQRHTYACLRYRRLVGADCPVMASIAHGEPHIAWLSHELKIPEAEAKERDRAVRALIAQELGHNRIEVTHAYLG
jgi:hypothetical protein